MIEEEGFVGAAHGLVQVSVGADDACALAAQLQSDRDHVLRRLPHYYLAHLCAACERDLAAHGRLSSHVSRKQEGEQVKDSVSLLHPNMQQLSKTAFGLL